MGSTALRDQECLSSFYACAHLRTSKRHSRIVQRLTRRLGGWRIPRPIPIVCHQGASSSTSTCLRPRARTAIEFVFPFVSSQLQKLHPASPAGAWFSRQHRLFSRPEIDDSPAHLALMAFHCEAHIANTCTAIRQGSHFIKDERVAESDRSGRTTGDTLNTLGAVARFRNPTYLGVAMSS